MKQSKKTNTVFLKVAVVGLLLAVTPAVAQTNDSTTTNTTTTTTQNSTNPDVGMVDGVPVRKDAWNWYWSEKAHIDIDPQDKAGFWGDDAISNFFRNMSNSFVIPFWNGAMEYDFIRVGLLLVVAGMLLGLGASIVMPKKLEATK